MFWEDQSLGSERGLLNSARRASDRPARPTVPSHELSRPGYRHGSASRARGALRKRHDVINGFRRPRSLSERRRGFTRNHLLRWERRTCNLLPRASFWTFPHPHTSPVTHEGSSGGRHLYTSENQIEYEPPPSIYHQHFILRRRKTAAAHVLGQTETIPEKMNHNNPERSESRLWFQQHGSSAKAKSLHFSIRKL